MFVQLLLLLFTVTAGQKHAFISIFIMSSLATYSPSVKSYSTDNSAAQFDSCNGFCTVAKQPIPSSVWFNSSITFADE